MALNPRNLPCNSPRRDVKGGKKFVVYKTTNLINGKVYVGVTKRKSHERGYIGCGVTSQRSAERRTARGVSGFCVAVAKYGYENFVSEILHDFDCESDAYEMEAKIVTPEFVSSQNSYNLCAGGYCAKPVLKMLAHRDEVIERYAAGESLVSIAKSFGVSHPTVKQVLPQETAIRPRNHWIKQGKKNKAIICNESGEVFSSLTDAGIKLYGRASGASSIRSQLSGVYKTAKGLTFKYAA
jgi:hypothetical protein